MKTLLTLIITGIFTVNFTAYEDAWINRTVSVPMDVTEGIYSYIFTAVKGNETASSEGCFYVNDNDGLDLYEFVKKWGK